MKRYRICYDKMLVAKGDLNINGELYGGVAAYLEYQVFNKSSGEEIFFTFDDTDTPREEKSKVIILMTFTILLMTRKMALSSFQPMN